MSPSSSSLPDRAIVWDDHHLQLLDQRRLPGRVDYLTLHDARQVAQAISDMVVRGAPAIGITAAYGVVLAAALRFAANPQSWKSAISEDLNLLAAARPTAVNLQWALERMQTLMQSLPADNNPQASLLQEAQRIHAKDVADNHTMGELGAALFEQKSAVITHCNAGALATGGYGTALGVIRSAFAQDRITQVYADETRPWLQGSRLTAWELLQDDIPVQLLADGAAAARMAAGGIGWVIVGSDRIAANGDVANKIGTYGLALAARYHAVRFMVVAPTSTIDMHLSSGEQIPIEQRDAGELLRCGESTIAAQGAGAWNPVFDVTPAGLVDVLVTEKGIIHAPNSEKMRELMG
ncbi:MAG: S-methyl-5-thioribose-1-phosphate isomerase [gamma proteobacterium symbiont of Bathyaustriella thionipta]|nr:S-methyl-5-thioribose-1-phosphate isomerase [gamma proteobacterium symbiont of Bathyaustriella thionipta]